MSTAEWVRDHPPPATLAVDGAEGDGPYRTSAGPLVIRQLGSRGLMVPPRSPGIEKWIRRARWSGAGTCASGLAVLLVGLGAGAAGAIQLGIGAFFVGITGFLFSFLDERERSVAPPHCQLALDRGRVRVSGAVRLAVALRDIRELDQHPSGELRVQRQGDRGERWPTLWTGPADERHWIAQLVRAAIATSSPSWP